MTNVLPDRESLTQPIAHRRYTPAIYDVDATAILRPDETLILAATVGDPDTSGDIVPLMRLLQDSPTGNPLPLPPQPKPKNALLRMLASPLPPLRPAAPGQPRPVPQPRPQTPRPNPAPPPANWRPMHRRPAPMWAYALASTGLVLATFASGWVSCWAVAL